MTPSCVVGLGSDRREDEAAARGEGVPSQHHQSSHPAETHALLWACPSTASCTGKWYDFFLNPSVTPCSWAQGWVHRNLSRLIFDKNFIVGHIHWLTQALGYISIFKYVLVCLFVIWFETLIKSVQFNLFCTITTILLHWLYSAVMKPPTPFILSWCRWGSCRRTLPSWGPSMLVRRLRPSWSKSRTWWRRGRSCWSLVRPVVYRSLQ